MAMMVKYYSRRLDRVPSLGHPGVICTGPKRVSFFQPRYRWINQIKSNQIYTMIVPEISPN